MRDAALKIIDHKIDDLTVNDLPSNARPEEVSKARMEKAQLSALASLSASLVFGMLAEVVMLRQAVQKTSEALGHIRDEMQMSRDLRVDDHG